MTPQKPFKHFVIFDLETTGLSPRYGDRMIEIAALKVNVPLRRVSDGKGWALNLNALCPGERFSSLLNVDQAISYEAYQVNGITAGMLKTAPRADEILPEFLKFINQGCLIGHNVRFDLGFLTNELSLAGLMLEATHFLDTVRLARRVLPELRRYSLFNLAHALGVGRAQEHRAMSDVELTYDVFRNLLNVADRQDICTVEELIDVCGGRYCGCEK